MAALVVDDGADLGDEPGDQRLGCVVGPDDGQVEGFAVGERDPAQVADGHRGAERPGRDPDTAVTADLEQAVLDGGHDLAQNGRAIIGLGSTDQDPTVEAMTGRPLGPLADGRWPTRTSSAEPGVPHEAPRDSHGAVA
ncbi:hypothetical protein ACWEVD_13460 [Nocardia thailandica]